MAKYECYVARYNDIVVYVGEGQRGRSNHVNSGKSHVVELNQLFFNGVKLDVEVTPCRSKVNAKMMESELISKLKPVLNVVENDNSDRENKVKELLVKIGVTKPDETYTGERIVNATTEPSEDDIGIKFKKEGAINLLYIKDVPVSYARVKKPYVWTDKKTGYVHDIYSIVVYLTFDQIVYLRDKVDIEIEYDKVDYKDRPQHADVREHPHGFDRYAVVLKRNVKGVNTKQNKIGLFDKVNGGLVPRERGIRNGTVCSIKAFYVEDSRFILHLDKVVVK